MPQYEVLYPGFIISDLGPRYWLRRDFFQQLAGQDNTGDSLAFLNVWKLPHIIQYDGHQRGKYRLPGSSLEPISRPESRNSTLSLQTSAW